MNPFWKRLAVGLGRLLVSMAALAAPAMADDLGAPDSSDDTQVQSEQPPSQDLTFVPNSVQASLVRLRAAATDANLRELLGHHVRLFLLDRSLRGAVSVLVPPTMPAPAGEATEVMPPPSPYDLIVRLALTAPIPAPADVAADCAAAIRKQWYAESTTVLETTQSHDAEPQASEGENALAGNAVVHVGVVLRAADTTKGYWRLAARVAWRVREPVPMPPTPITCWQWQPVVVLFTFSDGTGTAYTCRDTVDRDASGYHRALAFHALHHAATARLEGKAMVDPDNLIPEWDETNNTARFHWDYLPPPPDEDLYPIPERIQTRVVGCTATPRDPVLQSVLKRCARHALADVDGFLAVHLFPWHRTVAGLDTLIQMPERFEFDLVVLALFAGPAPTPADIDHLSTALTAQWSVAAAVTGPPCPGWDKRLPAAPYTLCQTAVPIFVRLERTSAIRRYWQVTVPVVRRTWNAPEPIPAADAPRQDWADLIGLYGAGFVTGWPNDVTSMLLPRPRLRPILVDVEVTAAWPHTAGTVLENRGWDHIWIAPNRRGQACAFVELANTPPRAGTVMVDPLHAVPETNETNNRCWFPFTPPEPPPQPQFRATAQIAAPALPGSDQPGNQLLIRARLSNPTAYPIVLTFPSSLQLDFRVGSFYLWSAHKMFTTALTQVVVAPGDAAVWKLYAPIDDLGWDGTITSINVFLSGTRYHHILPFPPPVPWLQTVPLPELDRTSDTAETGDLIVAPDGLDLTRLLERDQAAVLPGLVHTPLEGSLETSTGAWCYRALNGFQGTDLLVLGNALDPTRQTARRLNVGLQVFKLALQPGWNLVSFPIRPLLDADQLLARITGADAWIFRNDAYQPLEQINVGEAVWISCTETTELELLGVPVPERVRRLHRGWNLAGTVNDQDLAGLPGVRAVRAWNGTGYSDRRETRSGEGAWIYVDRDLDLPLY